MVAFTHAALQDGRSQQRDHADMTESENRRTLVEGSPDERAAARAVAHKRGRQGRVNRHWMFYALVMLGAIAYAIYLWRS